MVIRRSAAADIRALVGDLSASGEDAGTRREAAIARLTVLGPRAIGQLTSAFDQSEHAGTRVAILRVLEGLGDTRGHDLVLRALGDTDHGVRAAAASAAGRLLDGPRGAEALDRLTAVALDTAQPQSVRRAAAAALAHLPSRTLAPLAARLNDDPDPLLAAVLARPVEEVSPAAAESPDGPLDGDLPADPRRVLLALQDEGASAPLPVLHRLVSRIREREAAEQRPSGRAEWQAVRGGVHLALAQRDSRVALYDLRETLESADSPLPDAFLTAAARIGDDTCLEALAAAWTRAEPQAAAWRAALAATAAAIVAREGLTRRHGAVKRLQARRGGALAALVPELSTPSRTARG